MGALEQAGVSHTPHPLRRGAPSSMMPLERSPMSKRRLLPGAWRGSALSTPDLAAPSLPPWERVKPSTWSFRAGPPLRDSPLEAAAAGGSPGPCESETLESEESGFEAWFYNIFLSLCTKVYF